MTQLLRPPVFEPVLAPRIAVPVLAYPAAVMADNPLNYWRLGEPTTANTNVYDQAGGRLGTAVATPTRGVTGAVLSDPSTAYSFATGTTQYVNMAGYLTVPSPVTIEAWVNGASFQDMAVAGWFDNSGNNANCYIYITSVGVQTRFVLGAGTNDTQWDSTGVYSAGVWHQLAVTYDGTDARLYHNGALVVGPITKTAAGGLANTTFKIANYGAPSGTAFNGSIDEVSVYATALSTARILAHYHAAGY